jgi:hypothetical protein
LSDVEPAAAAGQEALMEPLRRQAGSRGETRQAREGQRPAAQRLLRPAVPRLLRPAVPQLLRPAVPRLLRRAVPQLLRPAMPRLSRAARLLAEDSAQRREQAATQRQRRAEPRPAEDSAGLETPAPASEVRWRLAAGLLRAASLFVALECWLAVPAVPSRFAPVTAATRQERRGRANKVRCPPAPPAL